MNQNADGERDLQKSLSLPPPASSPPMYVLESSLDTQHLWYITAGQRPKQPDHERRYFERLWAKNFENSNVPYEDDDVKDGKDVKQSSSASQLQSIATQVDRTEKIPSKEFDCEIIYRGKGPFSNSVSKSFLFYDLASLTLQLPRFRIVRMDSGSVHAEFLVVVSLGNKSTITFGIWRRHSDFQSLASRVHEENSRAGGEDSYKNTILSWQCVLHRKRWFRCLDKDYLSLKCFLLERFMHDLLFESHTPDMINEFLGLD